MGDSYDKDYRHLSYKLPSIPDILMTYPESVTKGVSVLTLHNDSLFYSLKLKGLDSVLRAYNVKLIPKQCTANTGSVLLMYYFHYTQTQKLTYLSLLPLLGHRPPSSCLHATLSCAVLIQSSFFPHFVYVCI